MPTYEWLPGFGREYLKLPPEKRALFRRVVAQMVEDMKAGRPFRPELRVHQVHQVPGVWEVTWAPNGRATFEYGPEQEPGEQHVVWRHIGGHEILNHP